MFISPILANIFLHFVFDKWMEKKFRNVHFERYADDIVVHCRTYKQLQFVGANIKNRFAACKLELCSEKTKMSIVRIQIAPKPIIPIVLTF